MSARGVVLTPRNSQTSWMYTSLMGLMCHTAVAMVWLMPIIDRAEGRKVVSGLNLVTLLLGEARRSTRGVFQLHLPYSTESDCNMLLVEWGSLESVTHQGSFLHAILEFLVMTISYHRGRGVRQQGSAFPLLLQFA
jgi:hypothetical protein